MTNKLYSYCQLRWDTAAWSEAELTIAVAKGYITEKEKTEIMTQQQQTE
ncbi:hypothetical protein [Brevibacillus borstelensis]|nr:hypothetical protein [Brevibacillus borstelensis]